MTTTLMIGDNEKVMKYDGDDYTAASMLCFLLFAKLARMKMEEALEFLSSNESYMKLIGFEKVSTKGAVTKFRKRMGADFSSIFGDFAEIYSVR